MNSERPTGRWQFSLRTFLFVILIVGPVAGVVVPVVIESITQWKPPPSSTKPVPTYSQPAPSAGSDNYYESGETPLY